MLPVTPLAERGQRQPYHEPINDLPAHPATGPQIFYPVPESRAFTRIDAGRVFSAAPALENEKREATAHPSDLAQDVIERVPGAIEMVGKGDNAQSVLLPADARIPHPHLVKMEMDRMANPHERREVAERNAKRIARHDEIDKTRREKKETFIQANLRHIEPEGGRFDFRFQNVEFSKQTTGPDGRGHKAPGSRYGVPHQGRKRGVSKIPTSVIA